MAMLCSQCGKELPQDARFCANCGAQWSVRSANSPSFAGMDNNLASNGTPPVDVDAATQDLREQASPQLPLREKSLPSIERPPAWMQGLQRERRSEPAPIKQTAASPMRALRVKVWNGADSQQANSELKASNTRLEDTQDVSIENKQSMNGRVQEEQTVADLPTHVMESISPQSSQTAIDDVPTNPVLALPDEQRKAAPEQQTYAQSQQKPEQVSSPDVSHIDTVQLQAQQQGQISSPSLSLKNEYSVETEQRSTFLIRPQNRLPLILGSSAVLLLLILALGSWLVLVQPFRVSPATDTQQSFTDSKLGVSLRYPSGWKKPQIDYRKQAITLQDGSDTAQMSISIANAPTGSPESFLQKQITQLGINNAKAGASSSFAGASWQNTQGDVQLKGAEYTCGVFTTLHNGRSYTLTQLAPRSVYVDEEKLVFAPARLSLHFLS